MELGFRASLCRWILDFLLERPQVVKLSGSNISKTAILNTGAPQGCVLSPALYSLFTHDCVSKEGDGTLTVKFADDTTLAGFITDVKRGKNDERKDDSEVASNTVREYESGYRNRVKEP